MSRTVSIWVQHALGIANAVCVVSSVAEGIYSQAAVNFVAMLYISTMYIQPKGKK